MKKKRFKSEGFCKLCRQNVEGEKISGHLSECRKKLLKADEQKPIKMMHILVDGGSPYWLQIAVWDGVKLSDIDSFLRRAWLECCGHLSAFRINGESYEDQSMEMPGLPFESKRRPMNVKLHKVLQVGSVFQHEYDFGSTTTLELEVLDVFPASIQPKPVTVLAHNLPPKIECRSCKAPATQICSCDSTCLCDKCAPGHECGEEMMLPLVNSPRTGVCGYCGPVRL